MPANREWASTTPGSDYELNDASGVGVTTPVTVEPVVDAATLAAALADVAQEVAVDDDDDDDGPGNPWADLAPTGASSHA